MPRNCDNKKPKDFRASSKIFKLKLLDAKKFFDKSVENNVLNQVEGTDAFELIREFWSFDDMD